jgi:hypothetical protein
MKLAGRIENNGGFILFRFEILDWEELIGAAPI